MTKHGPRPGVLNISGTGMPGGTVVKLDGEDISSAVRGLFVRIDVDDRPTAVLDVVLHELSQDLENPLVRVPEATHLLLVSLGWTPPSDGDGAS